MSKNKNFSDTAASRYSLALYELAEENKHTEEIEGQTSDLIKLIDMSEDFNSIIRNPTKTLTIKIYTQCKVIIIN